MILKRYILIFAIALISCAGTNYIQSIGGNGSSDTENVSEQSLEKEVVENDFSEMKGESLKVEQLK